MPRSGGTPAQGIPRETGVAQAEEHQIGEGAMQQEQVAQTLHVLVRCWPLCSRLREATGGFGHGPMSVDCETVAGRASPCIYGIHESTFKCS